MLHITSGDATGRPLRESGVPGDVASVIDPLHEGPALGGLAPAHWRAMRARFVADLGWDTFEGALARFDAEGAAIDRALSEDAVVLWFEHDLHCQLSLVRLLAVFARAGRARVHVSLVCIGAHPGRPDFAGLGQLTPAQLADLYPSRVPVTDAMLRLGSLAWEAFTSPDPMPLEPLAAADTHPLPFLGPALRRHLEQFPAVGSGLSRTERQALRAASAVSDARQVFRAVAGMEETVFMTDTIFWSHLQRMAVGRPALVDLAPPGAGFCEASVALTSAARAVLEGRLDWARSDGFERWLGGVHLTGPEPSWRWDPARRRLRIAS